MTEKYELSRRKALAALGTIGVAGAGAGMGTSAYLFDEEGFANNVIEAGTLNMALFAEVVAANDYWEGMGLDDAQAVADQGELVTGLQVHDIKPGDWAVICFKIYIWDNPGFVRICARDYNQYENGWTEPELNHAPNEDEATPSGSLGDPLDGDGTGELQDELVAEVYDSYNSNNQTNDDPRSGLSGLDPVASPNGEGSSFADVFDREQECLIIREETDGNSRGDPKPIPYNDEADEGYTGGELDDLIEQDDWSPSDGVVNDNDEVIIPPFLCEEWYLLLYLPEEVGNNVQSDAVEVGELAFQTEQVRNNDDPFSGENLGEP